MKKSIAAIAILMAYPLYGQINMQIDSIRSQIQLKEEYKILGKDSLIDRLFIPLDSIFIGRSTRYTFFDNITGLKTYIYGTQPKNYGYRICINEADSTVDFKPLELNCYYEIVGIIRFQEQLDAHIQRIKQLKPVPHKEEIEGKTVIDTTFAMKFANEIMIGDGGFGPWRSLLLSTRSFIDQFIVKDGTGIWPSFIYVLKNDKNDIYYVQGDDDFFDYPRLDVPYYERIANIYKGLEVCIVTPVLKDYLTGEAVNNPIAQEEGFRVPEKKRIDYRDFSKYFQHPQYAKCLDVLFDKGFFFGLFEYNGFKITLPLLNGDYSSSIEIMDYDDYKVVYEISNCGGRGYVAYSKTAIEEAQAEVQRLFASAEKAAALEKARIAKEKARIAKIREEEAEKAKEYKNKIILKYGEVYGNAILKGQVMLGMTKEMCREAWGIPVDSYNTTTVLGTTSVWLYNYKTYLHFVADKLVKIEN